MFRPVDLEKMTGISYRQIQYWDKTGLVVPKTRRGGRYRLYGDVEAMLLLTVVGLQSFGWSIQRIRKVLPQILEAFLRLDDWTGWLVVKKSGNSAVFPTKSFQTLAEAIEFFTADNTPFGAVISLEELWSKMEPYMVSEKTPVLDSNPAPVPTIDREAFLRP